MLVTNHEALGYFADRYDLEVVGAVIPSLTTSAGASAGELEALAEVIRERGRAGDLRRDHAADEARRRAGRRGRRRRRRSSSCTPRASATTGSGADTYVGMLRTDADRIAEALAVSFVLDAFSSDLTQRALARRAAGRDDDGADRDVGRRARAGVLRRRPRPRRAAGHRPRRHLGLRPHARGDRQRGRDGGRHQPRPPHDAACRRTPASGCCSSGCSPSASSSSAASRRTPAT